jgi:hypothetical protein
MKVNIGKYTKRDPGQKFNIEIDYFDTYSLDHTLALIILPALLQLKHTKHGVPSCFINDVGGENYSDQDSFDFYKESHDEAFERQSKLWDETLDKMIWSFQQIALEDYDEKYHHGKAHYDFVKSDTQYPNPVTGKMEDTFQMVDKNPSGHWYDHVGHQLHESRIQEGLELFGKYYRALWD